MGCTMAMEKLLLKVPVEGGNVLVRRSVDWGVDTLIMLSKPNETSAVCRNSMAGTSNAPRVGSAVRTSLPTAMHVMLHVDANGTMRSFTHL